MKKKLYALSGVFLIVLVLAGLWGSKAVSLTGAQDTLAPEATAMFNGVSMQKMVADSEVILFGTVLETKSEWIDARRLVTLATVSVTRSLKGDPPGTVTVAVPGGIGAKGKFQLATTYAGAPKMAPNEAVVLFLTEDGQIANAYSVVGFSAGKFSVVEDVDGGQVVANVPMRVRAPRVVGLASGNSQVIRLSDFEEMIRRYAN